MNPKAMMCNQNVTKMPRYKEPFTIFPRKLSSGKIVYYYRTYSPDGERTVAHSTGKTNKTQARNYCAELLSMGLLYDGASITFGAYAKDFFGDKSQWMLDKIQTSNGKAQPVAVNTLKAYRHCNEAFLIPFFARIKLCEIKPVHIKKFRGEMLEKELSNSVINLACVCLKIIFSYARADKLMNTNPFTSIQQMYINAKTRDAFTLDELKSAFGKKWESSERRLYALVSAVTGMRISEIAAIRKETLFPNYIEVKDQLNNGKLMPVKDGEKRKVRICRSLYVRLEICVSRSGNYAFSENPHTYRVSLYRNLDMTERERVSKGLSFHSLRHFLNTYLLVNKIPEIKVKCVMGHSSGKGSMTERYANFRPEHFDDVAELQEKLIKIFIG